MTFKKKNITIILSIITSLIGILIAVTYGVVLPQIHNSNNNGIITSFSNNLNNTRSVHIRTSLNQVGIWQSAMVDETGYEQVNQTAISKFENNAGKKLALVVFSNEWYNGISFPNSMANIVKQNNAVPIIRMAPWQNNGQSLSDAGPYTVSNIAMGQQDTALKKWAKAAKTFGSPILVDFGYEPNNDEFPWSKQGPVTYIAAYRHIVTIFRQQHANNVYFVYHPDMGSTPDNMRQWYPGDPYVDWILASAYGEDGNIGTLGVLNKSYHNLTAISLSKPLGIEEWGIGSSTDTKNTLNALAQNKFPRIRILSVWNEGPAGGIDRRIEQSPEMLNAYKAGIANSFYLSSNFNPTPAVQTANKSH
jgi:beta-mannanase